MRFTHIQDLPHANERAIIINCGTKTVSTLALVSTLRHVAMPVLVIDCESKDGSLEHFLGLMNRFPFDILSAPLRGHGNTLDWLFSTINADKVLLVDSDVEILEAGIFQFIREYIDEPWTFGAGFINGPKRIDDVPRNVLEGAYLKARLWKPVSVFKVQI